MRNDLLDDAGSWRDRDLLEELYLGRDWTQQQIADALDEETTDEVVTKWKVRKALYQHDLRKNAPRPPQRGLAKTLLDSPADAVGGDPA